MQSVASDVGSVRGGSAEKPNDAPASDRANRSHPDDPRVVYVSPNTCYCPDTPEQRLKFERMCVRVEERKATSARLNHPKGQQKPKSKKKSAPPLTAAKFEAYKAAFRQPQGAYDRGIVARY